jgi:integrase/recombinase XerD
MENQEYINLWLNKLKNMNNRSDGTVKVYKGCIEQFATFINKSLTEVEYDDIEKYLSNPLEKSATKQRKQTTICRFYNWMYDRKYCERHPMLDRESFSKPIRNPKFIEKKQWEVIDRWFRRDLSTFAKERNFVMVYFMIHSGVRAHETLNLKVDKINFEQQEVTVVGKRDKERIVQINAFVTRTLKNYINKYQLIDYVFPNNDGEILSKSSMDLLFREVSKKTGISITPHVTRHTYGQWEYDDGTPLEYIQKQMGHESGETTKIYARVRDRQVKAYINQKSDQD